MFSSRLPAQLSATELARAIAQARASGAEILDLTESNPTRAGIVYPEQAILDAFRDPRTLIYDPDSLGLPEARERIAAIEGVPADRILLTASSSEAYSWIFKLLCDPGDTIVTPRPSYPLFDLLAGFESVKVAHYPVRHHEGWFIDIPALREAITPRTRAIVVVSPNNPTGSYLKRAEFESLAAIGLPLIVDEVFRDYALTAPAPVVRDDSVLTFRLNGLSKLVGLPQMKLGWIAVSGPAAQCRDAIERLEIIADTYLSVGAPVQHALAALLAARESVQRQIVDRARGNLAFLREAVAGTVFTALNVEGGWNAILRAPRVRTDEEWVLKLLREQQVLVQPGYFYDFESEGYLVFSLLTREANFREGVRKITEAKI